MKNSIVLHPAMGIEVVNHLRQFGDVPNRGILAGQAVDSALTDLYGQGGGVYNDLDIFRNVPRIGGKDRSIVFANELTGRSELDLTRKSTYNGMALILETIESYDIKSVSRQGMLNFVNCTMGDGKYREKLTPQIVLAGFDLNCTRVAVDLATNRLVWDKHYEEFLRSRQLRIAMMHTPWHTLLRLAKKAEELPNVFVDFEAAAQACMGVSNSQFVSQMLKDKDISLRFGEKHQTIAEATRHRWAPYFSQEKTRLYQHSSTRWVEDLPPEEALKTVDLYEMVPRGALEPAVQRRCDQLGKGVLFFATKVVDESRRTKPASAREKVGAIASHRAKVAKKADLDYVLRCVKLFGSDYVQGQALPEVADKVAEWLAKHSYFTKHLLGMSLAQQYSRIQDITEVSREFGKKYYEGDVEAAMGVLETQATVQDVQSREKMEELLLLDYRRNLEPFEVKPLMLPQEIPARFEGFTVTELLTAAELRREGNVMDHCVGGYSHNVSSGRSRILRIKFGNERTSLNCSTVELHGNFNASTCADMDLDIIQNRSLKNKAPSPLNDEFVQFVLGYLTVADELVKSESSLERIRRAVQTEIECKKEVTDARSRINSLKDELRQLEFGVHSLDRAVEKAAQRTNTLCKLVDLSEFDALVVRQEVKATLEAEETIAEQLLAKELEAAAAYPASLNEVVDELACGANSAITRLQHAWFKFWAKPEPTQQLDN